MKPILCIGLILVLLQQTSAQRGVSPKFPAEDNEWMSQAQAYIARGEYVFRPTRTGSFAAANRAQKVMYAIGCNGYVVRSLDCDGRDASNTGWSSFFQLTAITRGENALIPGRKPLTRCTKNLLVQYHQGFSIEYTNDNNGLRQDFIVAKRPAGNQLLRVKLSIINTRLRKVLVNHQVVELRGKDGMRLRYDGLKVWDATGRSLDALMEIGGKEGITIRVDDRRAVYPVTVDPLNHTAEWTGTAQGILPSILGQAAIDAAYGFCVAGLGDVNGDGYADVAIGAPGLINAISGSGALMSVGAVFVYYGSSSGLPATPSAELQPSTAVAGALFGYSIASGDVNGDGKSDIIVGAPKDHITISTGGSGSASGTVGKVYVFSGATLTASVTTPTITLQLNGKNIIQNGINLSINALFGFSVAVADDLNGDGLNDIIVGAPAYAGIVTGLLGSSADVQSGGAFVFLSAGGSNYTMEKLSPPTGSLLGIGLLSTNISGLLFGTSVDGAGDYNGDGYADVVVGAAAGVDLGSLNVLLNGQLLQGSALVYYGTGAGVDLTPDATLAASAGGLLTSFTGTLSNVANLFGWVVKGARNAAGIRDGNILVGAPLGGTLTNLAGGMGVKTGTVSVFLKNPSAVSGVVTPNQQLSSPRNNNTILNAIQSSALFGFSVDNAGDINCDGKPDIIVGEPLSSGAELVGASVAGGSAYVFTGKGDGTYESNPVWTLNATYDPSLGVNLSALVGYSVAGAYKVRGSTGYNKILIGAPGMTLDFGSGLLNLGNTLGTLFGLAAGNNSVGKAFESDAGLCGLQSLPLQITQFGAKLVPVGQVLVSWSSFTASEVNDFVLQRSVNGFDWDSLTTVKAASGVNNLQSYSYLDDNPASGINYYRLQQVDINQDLFYTNTAVLDNESVFTPGVHATNPFSASITIRINALRQGSALLELLDLNGHRLSTKTISLNIGTNSFVISNTTSLARGIYCLRIINGSDALVTKLVKE